MDQNQHTSDTTKSESSTESTTSTTSTPKTTDGTDPFDTPEIRKLEEDLEKDVLGPTTSTTNTNSNQ